MNQIPTSELLFLAGLLAAGLAIVLEAFARWMGVELDYA